MIVVKRDNYSLLCTIEELDITYNRVPEKLEKLKEQFEKEGWSSFWDNEQFKAELTIYKEGQSFTFTATTRRVPRRGKYFVW